MPYEDLLVLIPSHSLEDFPAEQSEDDAASLLNSFAVLWHPALLATAKVLPTWNRADSPPESSRKRLVMVPRTCESWLPAGWTERIQSEGSVVVRHLSDRAMMLTEALAPLTDIQVDPDLAADFLALGFCNIQMELLTRKMRNYSSIDEVHLQREAVAAAEAAVAGDASLAREKLKGCFEVLQTARERFYPVDCYLLDICLLIPRLADQHLTNTLLTLKPLSVMAMVKDLDQIAIEQPAVHAALREAWDRKSADFITGEWLEPPSAVWPLASVLWQFEHGQQMLEKLYGHRATTWGRRRYGVGTQFPQILKKMQFSGGLHVVLDDGIYPDAEQTKFRWEGTDGSVVDAISRIPLAADASTSYLRLPDRMSESMDNDQVAGVLFARYPEVKSPFFEDLRRMANFAPVLGRWVTLADFFQNTDASTRLSTYKQKEYLAPYLVQSVAREERQPITRFIEHFARRQQFDNASWCHAMQSVLRGNSPQPNTGLELRLETLDEPVPDEAGQALDRDLQTFVDESTKALAEVVMHKAASLQHGYLVFNTLSFPRLVTLENFPRGSLQPQATGERSQVQWTETHRAMTVEVAGSGFTWIPASSAPATAPTSRAKIVPMAEDHVLRNEHFEVYISKETGGIAQIKKYDRSPNRLSQQLNFRFTRERTMTVGTGDDQEEVKSHYGEMRRHDTKITSVGPAYGEIVTTGEILDQKNNQSLAKFKQTVRVWRSRPVVELEIELDPSKIPDAEPWHNYFTSRFAWNDETAAITRSATLGAQDANGEGIERLEAPHYLEFATESTRATIIPMGLPFHRKTGPRMLDSILITQREERRKFKFVIAIDQDYPLQAALDALSPALMIPTTQGPPRSPQGWFFHLASRSVQILNLLPLLPEPVTPRDDWDHTPPPALVEGCGCSLRLLETEGRPIRAKLRCFRTPVSARQRDFAGKTLSELTIIDDAVMIDFTAHEIVDIELRF